MKITLRKLSTKDLATLAQRTINTSESGNYPVIDAHPLLAELKLKYSDYDAVYTKMTFSGKGNDVANSDNDRDLAYTTLKAFLNSYRKMLTLAGFQSAEYLYQIFRQFGLNLDRMSYSSQTAQMKKLIEELEKPENNQKLKDLKLTTAFDEMKDRLTKQTELDRVLEIENSLETEILERTQFQTEYLEKTKLITSKRNSFVADLMQDDKVKVTIIPFRNKSDFVYRLRTIIQRSTSFDGDIETLTEICFNGNVEQQIKSVREVFLKIKKDETITGISGHFVNLVKNLSDAQIDEIELLLPEDEIDIKYKPSGSTVFKPLSTASAGQKTTAILTFILSHGNIPLLLDQPEDDLDNRLVYELIVDRLKQAKENRQIIVVTHNANIPVNGDAEYILSMNSESKTLEILHEGTVENPAIKKEICDVMEGSEQAFDMRSKRYKQII